MVIQVTTSINNMENADQNRAPHLNILQSGG
jgi:hypothetical protein